MRIKISGGDHKSDDSGDNVEEDGGVDQDTDAGSDDGFADGRACYSRVPETAAGGKIGSKNFRNFIDHTPSYKFKTANMESWS